MVNDSSQLIPPPLTHVATPELDNDNPDGVTLLGLPSRIGSTAACIRTSNAQVRTLL